MSNTQSLPPPARGMKKGFRFESYADYVMGPSDDGYDYEEEIDDGEPPLSPKTVQRIIDSVWNTPTPTCENKNECCAQDYSAKSI
jgi:hypothetical protein